MIWINSVGQIIQKCAYCLKNLKLANMDVHLGVWTIYNIAKGRGGLKKPQKVKDLKTKDELWL